MSGLDINQDCIIEAAVIITDGNLNAVDNGISIPVQRSKAVMDK